MGARPPYPTTIMMGQWGKESLRISGIETRKVKGGFEHGAKPHTPLHGKNRIARAESAYGGQSMCWHMLSSERATNDACGIARHLGKAFVNMSAKSAPSRWQRESSNKIIHK